MIALCVLLLPWKAVHAQNQGSPVDSETVTYMSMMWMHLDSIGTWSPAAMLQMMPQYLNMAAYTMKIMGWGRTMGQGMMGSGMMGSSRYRSALRDSVELDLSVLPGLSGTDLTLRMRGHVDRLRRLMVLRMGMMGGGGWGSMPGGCAMMGSLGHMSPQHAQWMWGMHARMSGQMIDAMIANMHAGGAAPGPEWLSLRDSVRADLAQLPRLKGESLRSFLLAHQGRMQRLMGLQVQGMGMRMGVMGMGCPW
jgi:hypothetical protein